MSLDFSGTIRGKDLSKILRHNRKNVIQREANGHWICTNSLAKPHSTSQRSRSQRHQAQNAFTRSIRFLAIGPCGYFLFVIAFMNRVSLTPEWYDVIFGQQRRLRQSFASQPAAEGDTVSGSFIVTMKPLSQHFVTIRQITWLTLLLSSTAVLPSTGKRFNKPRIGYYLLIIVDVFQATMFYNIVPKRLCDFLFFSSSPEINKEP